MHAAHWHTVVALGAGECVMIEIEKLRGEVFDLTCMNTENLSNKWVPAFHGSSTKSVVVGL